MKRSVKNLVAAGSAAAVMVVAAPAAQAGPEDLPGCTTTYVNTLANMSTPSPSTLVTYNPPADVQVNGNAVVGVATYVTNATIAYVICVA